MLERTIRKITWRPRYFFDSLIYKIFSKDREIVKLKGRYEGGTVLIVGNGPSLNKTPLDKFIDVPSIGMNKIHLLFPKVSWRPSLIFCINNTVVQQGWMDFMEVNIPFFLPWKCRRFIPRVRRASFNYFPLKPSLRFSLDMSLGLGSGATVTYAALQAAYYMGAKTVILFGVDHSYAYSGKAAEYQTWKGDDVNHFSPEYFKNQVWGTPDLDMSEAAYLEARKVFEADGRKVLDATVGGKLEIFPKISIEEAERLCEV